MTHSCRDSQWLFWHCIDLERKSPKLEYFKLGVSVGVLDLHQGGLGRQYLLCNICSYCWYYCTPASLHLHAHCVQCTVCTACSVCNLCTLNWQLTCLGTFVCVQAGFSTFSGWFWISKLDSMSVPLDLSLISLVCIFCSQNKIYCFICLLVLLHLLFDTV